ncbi:irc3 [Symbiodinium natans]|uniref:Irc3 protein n=1 Tax=Symbiodinium natans TaxID=878477 RepID=A0A812P7U8_9DINO|nr:irc3 [Symbiodinium natans]
MPKGMPSCKDLFKFSATHKEEVDFRYSLGEAIEQGVLRDYDLTVPVTTEGHPYICLANLLLSQAGRFRRVLAYCNSIAEAKRFRRVLKTVGLAAWHINGETSLKERERVMRQFSGELTRRVHVLVTVQVLGEGVNIPNADTCMFVEPRSSYVSIVQAIGRVLRAHPCKPLAHVVLPALAVPHSPAGALPISAKSASPQVAVSSEAPPHASAEVSTASPSSSIHESPVPERVVDTRIALQETLLGGLEPHIWEASATQSARNSPPAFPGKKAADGQDGTSKDAGAEGIAGVPAAGRGERKQSVDGCEHQSAELEGGSVDRAGEPLVPVPKLTAGEAWLRNRIVTTQQSTAPRLAASDSDPGLVASMPDFGFTPLSRPGHSRSAVGMSMCESAVKLQQPCLLDVGPRVQALGQDSSLSSVEAVTRDHGNGSKIGAPCPGRNLRVRTRAAGDAEFLGSSYSEQLDRFLGAIARTDSRFAEQDARYLQSRLWVTDGRLNREVSLHPLVRSMQYELAMVLKQHDPWDVHLQAVEQFAQERGRLPGQRSTSLGERILGNWLRNVGYMHTRRKLPAAKMQKLLNSSCDSLRARAEKWLDPSTAFERRLEELQRFVQEHGRLPRQRSSSPTERLLGLWLGNIGYRQKKQSLPSDNMQKMLNSSCIMIRAVASRWLHPAPPTVFERQVEELQRFVQTHNRMPQGGRASPAGERKLLNGLMDKVKPGLSSSTRTKRLRLLAKLDPVVAEWVGLRPRKPRVQLRLWKARFSALRDFVRTNHRLPSRKYGEIGKHGRRGESSLNIWLVRQRRLLASLPSDLRAALFGSHPAIAAYLESGV